ncbi:glycopeptide [Pholiota conissans]|uniref:Glycopeptide n=1 Tax=Pholiota conissans TaxID=109636 RepID=A0A9P6CUZ0_9AGAR|nr:glycopeptide [Pholiota conissans]
MFSLKTIAFTLMAVVIGAHAESHTVTFDNRCGRGTPMLIQGPNVLSTGQPFTSNGPLISAIAYLQTGPCLFNGEGCTLVETTLVNPTSPGSGSSSDISLIPPHAFNVAAGFTYNNGCSGHTDCTDANCPTAFHKPDDTQVQVACQANNAGLTIIFCG